MGMPLQQLEKLSPELQTYSETLLSIGNKIQFIVQSEQLGLGHAVYEAKQAIGSEHFLLLLGDHLYKTNASDKDNKGCIQQLLGYYERTGVNCYGVQKNHVSEIKNFGTVAGKWIDNRRESIFIDQIVEKPKVDYARKHLRVDSLAENDEYLAIFGLYILDGARLVELLGNNINNKPPIRHNGSFQLTPCLNLLRKEQETHGLIMKGERFDIGASPTSYVQTVANFHKIERLKGMRHSASMQKMIDGDEQQSVVKEKDKSLLIVIDALINSMNE